MSVYNEQDLPKRRGRIPHTAWPAIADRYKSGATLSAIAREYDCTPSAISYILKKIEDSGIPAGSGGESTEERPAVTASVPKAETPPMDEIEARLHATSSACLNAYRAWRQPGQEDGRRGLADAMHELRKVVARIEIELSASRRDEHAMQPIPLPLHRAAQRFNNAR